MAKSDRYFVEQTLAGSKDAFAELVRRHQGAVYGFAVHLVGRYGEAEDCAQEAFLQAYKSLRTLHDPDMFVSWLRGITYRVCMSWLRRERSRENSDAKVPIENVAETMATPLLFHNDPVRRESAHLVMKAIRKLPEQYRLPVILRYLQELSYDEIAEFTGVTKGAVRGILYRANQMLRTELRYLITEEK
ncbi:MAG: sigma-70 family RNA polymerase sigma factor [Candidatus Hydrogenedentes bacterium]|nr:sigma-70 family RNA polymerase sigma factor [Candidatus Hydrogenedentota bacterium]